MLEGGASSEKYEKCSYVIQKLTALFFFLYLAGNLIFSQLMPEMKKRYILFFCKLTEKKVGNYQQRYYLQEKKAEKIAERYKNACYTHLNIFSTPHFPLGYLTRNGVLFRAFDVQQQSIDCQCSPRIF